MNYIDKNFYDLIKQFKTSSTQEIFEHIKNLYVNLNPETKKGIEKFLNDFNYWGLLKEEEDNFEEIEKKAKALKENYKEYQKLYESLEDYRSKLVLLATINNWYNYDFKTLSKVIENTYDDYFDLDLIKPNKEEVLVDLGAYIGDTAISFTQNYGDNYKKIYCFEISPETIEYLKANTSSIPNLEIIEKGVSEPNKEEVLVDLGAYIGDTAISFTQNYGDNYKKIYCFEISPETIEYLKANTSSIPNLEIIEKGVSDKKGEEYLKINESGISANTLSKEGETKVQITTLDDEIKEKITIIKSDIEGMEQKALKGAQNHIKASHPKLLISIYHSNEDIWQIPKMIKEMDNTYKFYLRYHGGPIYPTEITLIAI